MNNDEIVENILSIIHSTTKSNYVLCSQVSSKIFSYLSQIQFKDHQWNELNQAIQRFDQSFEHPDLQQVRKLIEIISNCSKDCEERNYTLGRDKNLLMKSINELRDLLKSHVELHCFLLKKLIEKEEIRLQLIDLMNLTGMNIGNELHGVIFEIVHFLCKIDPQFLTSNVIDHPIVLSTIRLVQEKSNEAMVQALNLLTDLVLTNESFPIETNSQLSNWSFLKCIFEIIEDNSENDELIMVSMKFFLAFNLRFDYPNENPIILTLITLTEQISCRELIERSILFLNRNIDPIQHPATNSIIKFLADLFSEQSSIYFSDSDRRLIIEIISRELSDRSCSEDITTSYLSLLELILRNQILTSETCTRINELQSCFQTYLSTENCLDENRFIINEILREHKSLDINSSR